MVAASCVESARIHAELKVPSLAHRHCQLERAGWPQPMRSPLWHHRARGYFPQLLGQPIPRPITIFESTVAWMPRWQNLENPKHEKFIRGYSVYPDGGCDSFPGYYGHLEGFGSQFKKNIKRYYPSPIGSLIQVLPFQVPPIMWI